MQHSISICGSMKFLIEMENIAKFLAAFGHEVMTPEREESHLDWSNLKDANLVKLKKSFIDCHLEKIKRSDFVLIANFSKNGISGYVGPNTLMEASFAHALGVQVIFLYDPSQQSCGLECLAIMSKCLDGNAHDIVNALKCRQLSRFQNLASAHVISLKPNKPDRW
ncbi:hypothetical protein [Pseudomonas putida]|uniref:hypothetical protein n=1 Tax=Pseudomonas putida TaxID=303 RepID=UPI0011981FA2|nr:hypothetical protein [Pseudomonas putida]